MATITKQVTENEISYNPKATWTFTTIGNDVIITGDTFTLTSPTIKAKYVGSNKGYAGGYARIYDFTTPNDAGAWPVNWKYGKNNLNAWTSGTTLTFTKIGDNHKVTYDTSRFFNSNNPNQKVINIQVEPEWTWGYGKSASNKTGTTNFNSAGTNLTTTTSSKQTIATLTLNAPPRFTHGELSFNTTEIHAGITTVSVDVDVTSTGLGAQYGGTISSIVLKVGNQQSNVLTGNGTLSILLNEPGTFTPTITVTDSRGQTTNVGRVNPITVLPYECQVSNVKIERINTNGIGDDEGTNVVLQGTFIHTHDTTANSTLIAPLVQLNNSGTLTTINNITWYTNWTSTEGFSGPITSNSDWQTLTSPITIYAKLTDTFAKENSYDLLITPKTTIKPTGGALMAVTIPQSFYLLVGAAGGHGLGIGMKPLTDALYVDMDSYFYKNIIIDDPLNDSITMSVMMNKLYISTDGSGTTDGSIVIPNGAAYTAKNSNGNEKRLCYITSANNYIFGYDNYADGDSNTGTYLYGNEIYIRANTTNSGNITTNTRIILPNNTSLRSKTNNGNNSYALIYANDSDNIIIGNSSWNDCYIYRVYNSGTGTVSTVPNVRILDNSRLTRTTHANSSMRIKHDIKDIENKELDPHRLYGIEVKQFIYNDDVITDKNDCRYHKEIAGFIAEQLHECYPIAVDINEKGECEAWQAQYIIPPMLKLIQEQHEEIEQLKKEVAELKNR